MNIFKGSGCPVSLNITLSLFQRITATEKNVLQLFKDGNVVDRIVGVAPQSRLEELVERALRKGHLFRGIRSDGKGRERLNARWEKTQVILQMGKNLDRQEG